jgi:excisionase family DNA binding protein
VRKPYKIVKENLGLVLNQKKPNSMAVSFLTNITEEEFKIFLKQALAEILRESQQNKGSIQPSTLNAVFNPNLTEILDIKQAAEFLHLKVPTLYEKTFLKTIPHAKKGNKLYFRKSELEAWLNEGKVKTNKEMQGIAATLCVKREMNKLR